MDVELVESAYEAWTRHDVERLIELTHPDVDIAPLVVGVTSTGPWHGHGASGSSWRRRVVAGRSSTSTARKS